MSVTLEVGAAGASPPQGPDLSLDDVERTLRRAVERVGRRRLRAGVPQPRACRGCRSWPSSTACRWRCSSASSSRRPRRSRRKLVLDLEALSGARPRRRRCSASCARSSSSVATSTAGCCRSATTTSRALAVLRRATPPRAVTQLDEWGALVESARPRPRPPDPAVPPPAADRRRCPRREPRTSCPGAAPARQRRGARRAEVRRHVGRRPRAHPRGRRPRRPHRAAAATRSSSWSAPWARRPTSCSAWPHAGVRRPARPRDGHAHHRRRAQGHGAAVHGAARPRRAGRLRSPAARPGSSPTPPTPTPRSSSAARPGPRGARRRAGAGRRRRPGRVDRPATSRSSAGAAPTPPPSRWPHALGADACELYTDVSGVFTADPRVVPDGPAHRAGSRFDELLEMTASGCPKPAMRSVEFARTIGRAAARALELHLGAGHLGRRGGPDHGAGHHLGRHRTTTREAKVTVAGVPDQPGIAARLFRPLADRDVNVDMIVQNVSRPRRDRHLLHGAQGRPADGRRGAPRRWPPRSAPRASPPTPPSPG